MPPPPCHTQDRQSSQSPGPGHKGGEYFFLLPHLHHLLPRGVYHLPALDDSPLVPLEVVGSDQEEGEHGQSLQSHPLPHVVLRRGGPHKERGDILGHRDIHHVIVERRGHDSHPTHVVGVEVPVLHEADHCWRVVVAVDEGINVVLALIPVHGDKGRVRRNGFIISRGRSCIILAQGLEK